MRLIISTISENDAPRVARCLVEERLVACVNIVPAVRSIYSWQGKIEDDSEALMLMKTTAETVRRSRQSERTELFVNRVFEKDGGARRAAPPSRRDRSSVYSSCGIPPRWTIISI